MEKDIDWLREQIKEARNKLNKRIQKLKIRLGIVKDRKKDLAQVELKLRSMRAIATRIRDEDLDESKQEQLVDRFNDLQEEVKELDEDIEFLNAN